jgi:hypothetical protein
MPHTKEHSEEESAKRFMHEPGECFCHAVGDKPKLLHILASVVEGETPAGTACEEYMAKCGAESQSWGMPSHGIEPAQFMSVVEATANGVIQCEGCFTQEESLINSPEHQENL